MKEDINIRVSPAEAASHGALQKYAERAAAERGVPLNEWRIVRNVISVAFFYMYCSYVLVCVNKCSIG